jgi:hypothetical protein
VTLSEISSVFDIFLKSGKFKKHIYTLWFPLEQQMKNGILDNQLSVTDPSDLVQLRLQGTDTLRLTKLRPSLPGRS